MRGWTDKIWPPLHLRLESLAMDRGERPDPYRRPGGYPGRYGEPGPASPREGFYRGPGPMEGPRREQRPGPPFGSPLGRTGELRGFI